MKYVSDNLFIFRSSFLYKIKRGEGEKFMELSAVAVQQSMFQQKMSVAMVKQAAQAEQAVADMVSSLASGRGQNVDILV